MCHTQSGHTLAHSRLGGSALAFLSVEDVLLPPPPTMASLISFRSSNDIAKRSSPLPSLRPHPLSSFLRLHTAHLELAYYIQMLASPLNRVRPQPICLNLN